MREEFVTPGGVRKKPPEPKKDGFDSFQTEGYDYGQTKRKLKVGLEVEGSSQSSTATGGFGSITSTGTQSFNLGFQPSLVRISAVLIANPGSASDGIATPSYQGVRVTYPNAGTTQWSIFSGTNTIRITDGSANTTTASVSITPTGFDLVCGAFTTGTVYFLYDAH